MLLHVFATGCKLGDQMIAVKKMLDRVAGIMA